MHRRMRRARADRGAACALRQIGRKINPSDPAGASAASRANRRSRGLRPLRRATSEMTRLRRVTPMTHTRPEGVEKDCSGLWRWSAGRRNKRTRHPEPIEERRRRPDDAVADRGRRIVPTSPATGRPRRRLRCWLTSAETARALSLHGRGQPLLANLERDRDLGRPISLVEVEKQRARSVDASVARSPVSSNRISLWGSTVLTRCSWRAPSRSHRILGA